MPNAFARACESGGVRVLYVVPYGLNPMARLMETERRQQIVEIARQCGVLILENDAGGPLQPRRPKPFASLAPERTFYFAGLSKCLMSGLCYGFLVVPETLISAALNRHLVTNWMASPLMAEIATRWIEDGTAEALLDWQRAALGARNRLAARTLARVPFSATPNSLHLWLSLPAPWCEESFVAHARHRGVAVASGAAFAIGDPVRHRGVRVCLGAASVAELERALAALVRLVHDQPEPALLAV